MREFVLVCLGGALGSGARYLVGAWALSVLGPSFAWGTLLVNVAGSFLLSAVMVAGVEAQAISPAVRLALGTGVMGGFTTYSTFSFETMRYLQEGMPAHAAANVVLTVGGCLAASVAGWAAARSFFLS